MNSDVFIHQLERIDSRLPLTIGVVVGVGSVLLIVVRVMKAVREHGYYNLLRDLALLLGVFTCLAPLGAGVWLVARATADAPGTAGADTARGPGPAPALQA